MEIRPVPPQKFCVRLKRFDPNLMLNWDPGHGVWAIWHKDSTSGEVSHVMNVVEPDGSYRMLDNKVFDNLRMNRFYARNPDLAERDFVDKVLEQHEREENFANDELRHFAKDKTLIRKFNETKERARSVSWNTWQNPQQLSGGIYMPHNSIKRG